MKRLVWLAALLLAISASSGVMAQVSLDLSPYPDQYQGEIIEVPPGDIEVLYFHIDDGGEGGLYHVADVSFHYVASDPGAWAEVLTYDVQPSFEYTASVWYPYGVIKVDGPPSTLIDIQIDLTLQQPIGTIWSNTITKHITPEPSSLLALGTGLLGAGGLLLRRRRS